MVAAHGNHAINERIHEGEGCFENVRSRKMKVKLITTGYVKQKARSVCGAPVFHSEIFWRGTRRSHKIANQSDLRAVTFNE